MDRQNVAYDLSMYETLLEHKAEKKEEKQPAKVIKIKNRHTFKTVINVLSIAIIVSLIIAVIYTNASITQTTNQIAKTQKAITEIESEKAYLEFTLESRMSLDEIETYAVNVLGMVKMDSSQVEYVEIESENKTEFSGEKLADKIGEAVEPVLSYFQP